MGAYVASQFVKALIKKQVAVGGSRVLVMGLAFKENCPDIRNTRVIDIVHELRDYGCLVEVADPVVLAEEVKHEYGISLTQEPQLGAYDGIILAVAHEEFRAMGVDAIHALGKADHVVYDLKYVLPAAASDLRL